MPKPEEDGLTFPEDAERSWRAYLADFKSEVWPVFEAQGFSMDAAIVCWMLNRVNNNIDSLLVKIDGEG